MQDTYMGHGLRKDLVEKLKAPEPAVLAVPAAVLWKAFPGNSHGSEMVRGRYGNVPVIS